LCLSRTAESRHRDRNRQGSNSYGPSSRTLQHIRLLG
jgi:hypothetical protein